MQVRSIGKNNTGFATLEILLAFAVLTLCISAVIMVAFGNQSVAIDSETNNEAIAKAQKVLEDARAMSRTNFSDPSLDAGTILTPEMSGPLTYNKNVTIADLTECKKKVTGTVTWNTGSRTLNTTLSTVLSDVAGALALGGDCPTEPPTTPWTNPQTYTHADITPGGNEGSGIDVLKINGHTYAFLTSVHSNASSDDFWVFDVEVPFGVEPSILSHLNAGKGLNAVDVARDIDSGEVYAYVLENDNSNQLKVIQVTDPNNPTLIASATRTLPNMNHTCTPPANPCLAGQSIFFYDGYLYIGTNYIQNLTAPTFQNNEFHIYCVSDTSIPGCSPASPVWLSSYNVNHNVNSIAIVGKTAYIATSWDDKELTVLDVIDPYTISPSANNFNALGAEDGTSVIVTGNKIYLGRKQTASGRPELYILKKSDLSIIANKDLNLSPAGASVIDIAVGSNFIFLGTSDSNSEFQVWNSDNLNSIWSDFDFPQAVTGIEYLDNKVYTVVKSNDALHIIYDEP